MGYFEKTLNKITSSFFNNSKLKNNALQSLRLLFERNNKFYDSVSNIGNVFRNSKWSDLKVQNIKSSFIGPKASRSVIVTLVVLIVTCIVELGHQHNTLPYIPLLGPIIEQAYLLLNQLYDYVLVLLVALYYTVKGLESYIKNQVERVKLKLMRVEPSERDNRGDMNYDLPHDQVYNFDNFTKQLLTRDPLNRTLSPDCANSWSSWLKACFYLHQARTSTRGVTNLPHPDLLTNQKVLISTNRTMLGPLTNTSTSTAYLSARTSRVNTAAYVPEALSDRERGYVLDSSSVSNLSAPCLAPELRLVWGSSNPSKVFTVVPADIIDFGLKNPYLNPLNLNIETCLELAKQDRWLIKNTLGSDTLDIGNNAFTQSQKLITASTLLHNTFGANIWLSSRFNNLSLLKSSEASSSMTDLLYPTTTPSSVDKLNALFIPNSKLSNFNFIELSRVWTAKRYAMIASPISLKYTLSGADADTRGENAINNTPLSLLDVFAATQAVSLPNNLYDLNLSILGNVRGTNKVVYIPVGDMQNDITESDIILNEDLQFLSAITSNVTTDKRIYHNSWYH